MNKLFMQNINRISKKHQLSLEIGGDYSLLNNIIILLYHIYLYFTMSDGGAMTSTHNVILQSAICIPKPFCRIMVKFASIPLVSEFTMANSN